MQARQPFVMEVEGDRTLGDLLRPAPPLVVMLWEEATVRLADALPDEVPSVRLIVGPEGGFTDDEVGLAMSHGWLAVGLGPRILRVGVLRGRGSIPGVDAAPDRPAMSPRFYASTAREPTGRTRAIRSPG